MDAALSAMSFQMTLMKRIDLIADNIANVSTSGFKSLLMVISKGEDTAADSTTENQVTIVRDVRDGPMTRTGNTLDLAIQGSGYFAIETADGVRYTRNGRFALDQDGRLVTPDGHAVLGDGGRPITFTATETDIVIGTDGTVRADGGEIGTIGIVQFADEQALYRVSSGLLATEAPPIPAVDARILQGMVEESNVVAVLEITRMIETMRTFQSAQKMIESEHERQRRAIQTLTQIS